MRVPRFDRTCYRSRDRPAGAPAKVLPTILLQKGLVEEDFLSVWGRQRAGENTGWTPVPRFLIGLPVADVARPAQTFFETEEQPTNRYCATGIGLALRRRAE